MKIMFRSFVFCCMFLALSYLPPLASLDFGGFPVVQIANAQLESLGLATYLPIQNSKVEKGDIVVTSQKGYILSKTPYDQAFTGVVETEPAISLRSDEDKNGYPVISAGAVDTKVTDINGPIKKGDYITTSRMEGVGMKATESGYVIGQALSNVSFGKKGEIKLVSITINPHIMQIQPEIGNSLFNIFKLSTIAAYEKPSKTLQYVLAALITLISFGAGFLIFAKAVNTGLEALGRNPLAGRMIQLSLVFNLLMIVVVVIVGTGLAYLVLRL